MIDAEKRRRATAAADYAWSADCFYRGPIARELDAWSRCHGGLLRYSDLATHVTRIEDPVAIEYRGHRSQVRPVDPGPDLLETLQLLERFDLRGLGHNRPRVRPPAIEAMKLAMADRDAYYADPLFVDVPLARLLSPRLCRAAAAADRPDAGRRWSNGRAIRDWAAALLGIAPAGRAAAERPSATRPPAWSPIAGATSSRPRPAAGPA